MRVLYIGEIVGKGGVFCVKKILPGLKKEKEIDFVIANGEGATGGYGLGKNHSVYLHKLGIDSITGGDRLYFKKDLIPHMVNSSYILRPANYPFGNPGRGWWMYTVGDVKVAVIVLLGQSGFDRIHLSNPFLFLSDLLPRVRKETKTIILDFHAATTAEKYTMFHYAEGKVSAVIGSHFRVLTSDEKILSGGTGIITDSGRTGSFDSVCGLDPEIEIQKHLTQIPERSKDAWDSLELQGVLLDINEFGKTTSIERIKCKCSEVPNDGNGNN